MSPELDAVMKDWLREWQPGQAIPAGGPFQAGRYSPRGAAEAVERERQSEAFFRQGQEANRNGDNYVLTGVLFAVVLFFAGLAAKVASPQVANDMAYGTIALSIIGIVCLLIQPQRLPI